MLKKFKVLLLFFSVCAIALGQSEPEYNDTSYFIPFDEDFNLIISASKGDLKNVHNLLERGADINAVTVDNISALMYASENGDVVMVEYLLDRGADPNIRPYNGITALISAARLNYPEIAELLVNNGAKINAADEEGVTSLHYAVAYNYTNLLEMLLYYGANPQIEDKDGNTPLITAAYNNSYESLKILLEDQVNPDQQDKLGFTPLMVSIQENNDSLAYYLLKQEVDVNKVNKGGMTALAFAILTEDKEMVAELIERGADTNHRIDGSTNILSLAMETGNEQIIELLEAADAHPVYVPGFNEISIGPEIVFSSDDFITAFSISLDDNRYNSSITGGFAFRPVAVRVLTDPENDTLYQFWERRYYVYTGLEKRFAILRPGLNGESGPFLSLRAAYTFGNYHGSNTKPDPRMLISPQVGWYARNDWLAIDIHYQYMDFGINESSSHHLGISLSVAIPLTNKNMKEKNIDWLENE